MFFLPSRASVGPTGPGALSEARVGGRRRFASPDRLRRARAGQRGQVVAVTALMVPLLFGFTALSVDVSNISAQRRVLQAVADHTALTAGYQLLSSKTRAQATAAAQQITTLDGYQTAELAITYYDSAHVVALTDASVAYVATVVTHPVRSYFGGIFGVTTKTLAIKAEAHITNATTVTSNAWCAICVLNPIMVKAFDNQDQMTIKNGGVEVVSNAAGGLSNTSSMALSGTNNVVRVGGASISGSLPTGATIKYNVAFPQPDPFAYLTQPTTGAAGPGADVVAGATLAPGTYHNVTIGAGTTLTAGGLYVFTGAVTISSASYLKSNHALLYFACPTYPVACTPGAVVGGSFTDQSNNASMTVSRVIGGLWDGMSIFFDRNLKTNCNIKESGGSAFDGGIYLKSGFMNMATQSQLTGWNVRIAADHVYWNASGNSATFDAAGVVGHMLTVVLST